MRAVPTLLFAATIAVLSTSLACGVVLTLSPEASGVNRFDIELTLNESLRDADTSTVSGSLNADFAWELIDGEARLTGLTIVDGTLAFTDLSFRIGFPPFLGVTISGVGVKGAVSTNTAPSIVTNGMFAASDHTLTIDQGVFDVAGIITDSFDISTLPFKGTGQGAGMIELTEIDRTSLNITYDVAVRMPLMFSDRVLDAAAGDQATLDLAVDGLVAAVGQWVVPLSVVASADFDLDEDVDGDDLLIWQRGIGMGPMAMTSEGDANADGRIDDQDFTIWEAEFSQPQVSAGAARRP